MQCQRCRSKFKYHLDDVEACDCTTVYVSKETLDFLKNTHYDCICNQCLEEINKRVDVAVKSPKQQVEGIHYHVENGLLVFTDIFLIQRGYCCTNGCKNCPYGFHSK